MSLQKHQLTPHRFLFCFVQDPCLNANLETMQTLMLLLSGSASPICLFVPHMWMWSYNCLFLFVYTCECECGRIAAGWNLETMRFGCHCSGKLYCSVHHVYNRAKRKRIATRSNILARQEKRLGRHVKVCSQWGLDKAGGGSKETAYSPFFPCVIFIRVIAS